VTLTQSAMNVGSALQHAADLGLERLDAQMLLLDALGRSASDRSWLLAHDTDLLPDVYLATFLTRVHRRMAGEPLAYITGVKEFYGLSLRVDARVLDPRADTETLVDWALELLLGHPGARVVDLGTGSGAIALALKHQRPDLQVCAVDASSEALDVARGNAKRLGLDVQFTRGSWLEAVTQRFDAIVANPPYVRAGDPHLTTLRHEPLQALTSGADGLDDIRAIISHAPARLQDGGWLLLEHGYDQAGAVCALLLDAGFSETQSRRDLAGVARCSGATWRHSP